MLNDEMFEKCVLCGAITDVPRNMPISSRYYYVEGCGQVCHGCYNQTYNNQTKKRNTGV